MSDAVPKAQESRAGEQKRGPHPVVRGIGVIVLVPVIVAVMLTMFAWPAANTEPRDVPIGLVAPPPVASQVEAKLGGKFAVETYADEKKATAAIKDREVYGALVIAAPGAPPAAPKNPPPGESEKGPGSQTGPGGPIGPPQAKVLTASAASPMIAQLLGQMGTQMSAEMAKQLGGAGGSGGEAGAGAGAGAVVPPKVVDVVPSAAGDPRGSVLASSVLPLVMAGMLCGMLLFLLVRPGFGQAFTLLIVGAGGGLVVVGIAQFWLDALGGDWWMNAGVLGLTILAIGGGIAALGAILGRAGAALGAATMMLLGNPLSAITSAPEMLPEWAGKTGQLLPPGAGGTLLRSVAYFDGAGATRPLMVLGIWAGAALVLIILGRFLPWNRPKDQLAADDQGLDHGLDRGVDRGVGGQDMGLDPGPGQGRPGAGGLDQGRPGLFDDEPATARD